ncbi:VanZ family protein [Phenylobacterium sp.]|jgi:VanZ family protein|uniref:VanZ family protein n=1 Tax=Phenylobacterium sp. TaxID=1871053 RepID=UPI002F41A72E
MFAPCRLPLPVKAAVLAVCLGVLSWLSLAPTDELPTVDLWDKSEHAIAYAVLATACVLMFPSRLGRIILGCVGFGVLIEFLQAAMGFGRQGDWRDAAANTVGVLLVAAVHLLVRRLTRRGGT